TVLLGTAVCIYLEALVGIRCYSELHLWQLKSEVGRLNTTLIAQDVDFLRTAIQKDLAAVTTEKRPDDIEIELMPSTARIELRRRFLQFLPIGHRLSALVFGIGPRRRSLPETIQISAATAANIARMRKFGPQYAWFHQTLEAHSNSRRARVAIEILFPLLF